MDKMQQSLQSLQSIIIIIILIPLYNTGNLTNTLSMLQPSGSSPFRYTVLRCFSVAFLYSTGLTANFVNAFLQFKFNFTSIQFQSTHKFSSDISVLIQCLYSALTVLIQFTSRQTKTRPTQRSQIRKFNVDP